MSRRQGPTRSLVFAPGVRAACRNTSVDLQERSRMPRDSTRGAPRAAHQSVRAVSGSTTGRAGKENQELQIDKPGREMRRTWPNRHGVGAASDRLMPDAKQRHANIRPQRIVGMWESNGAGSAAVDADIALMQSHQDVIARRRARGRQMGAGLPRRLRRPRHSSHALSRFPPGRAADSHRSVAKLFGTNRRNAPSRQKRRAPFAAARCFWLLLLPPAVCRGGEEEQEEEEEEEEEEKEEEEAAAAARDADGLEAAACGAASR
ncbi:unnamed protein product [Prorocentrum cordatum]|uniref:Uncharacterized protein n=1 Tax=Prorocentrum cordatum TaxID=2364126 RepID=A0ABN9WTK9_9DINO|nr:unnamed protein product [Polarella glacialis]